MRPPSAIIADDEAPLRAELKAHLETLWPELNIVGVAADGIEALEMYDRLKATVLFVDVVMPGLSGLDVALQVEGRAHVVFVTAYDAHAIHAFERGAVDYLLKPYSAARLELALRRVRERLEVAPARLDTLLRDLVRSSEKRDYLKWINASRANEIQLVTVDEVLYFQADTKYTRVVTETSEALIRKSLKELAGQLDPVQFWTIHRSTIVNADAIAAVVRDMSGAMCVKLKSRPEKLRVSDAYRNLFRQM